MDSVQSFSSAFIAQQQLRWDWVSTTLRCWMLVTHVIFTSCTVLHFFWFLFKDVLLYLKAEDTQRKTESFCLLVHYSNAHHNQGWTRLKPWARSSTQVSHVDNRDPNHWSSPLLPRHISRSWIGSWATGLQPVLWHGNASVPRQWLDLLCYKAHPFRVNHSSMWKPLSTRMLYKNGLLGGFIPRAGICQLNHQCQKK